MESQSREEQFREVLGKFFGNCAYFDEYGVWRFLT